MDKRRLVKVVTEVGCQSSQDSGVISIIPVDIGKAIHRAYIGTVRSLGERLS